MARWDGGKPTLNWIDEMFRTRPAGCWVWPFSGAGSWRKYPAVKSPEEGTRYVSHLVLERDGRPRPEGMSALHSCDNHRCVNPDHLRWGTHKENMEDMVQRGRWAGKRESR